MVAEGVLMFNVHLCRHCPDVLGLVSRGESSIVLLNRPSGFHIFVDASLTVKYLVFVEAGNISCVLDQNPCFTYIGQTKILRIGFDS